MAKKGLFWILDQRRLPPTAKKTKQSLLPFTPFLSYFVVRKDAPDAAVNGVNGKMLFYQIMLLHFYLFAG